MLNRRPSTARRTIAVLAGLVVVLLLAVPVLSGSFAAPSPLALHRLYLPLVYNQKPPTPTPTATSSPGVTVSPTATPTATATATPGPEVVFVSGCWEVLSGTLYVFGEVLNETGQTVDSVRVTANGRDLSGSLVWTDSTDVVIGLLAPGDTAPFNFIDRSGAPIEYQDIEFEVDWDWASPDQELAELTVLADDCWSDYGTYWECQGEARNDTGRAVTSPLAVVTHYVSTQGGEMVVGNGWAYLDPVITQPGETVGFSIWGSTVCYIPHYRDVRVIANFIE